MAVSIDWGPFCGCPCNRSPIIWGLYQSRCCYRVYMLYTSGLIIRTLLFGVSIFCAYIIYICMYIGYFYRLGSSFVGVLVIRALLSLVMPGPLVSVYIYIYAEYLSLSLSLPLSLSPALSLSLSLSLSPALSLSLPLSPYMYAHVYMHTFICIYIQTIYL